MLYYAPCPAKGRSPPKAVNGRGRAGCLYVTYTFIRTYKVTTGYNCEWLLCILGWVLQDTDLRRYHVLLPPLVFQKRKPQIDGLFLNVLEKLFQWKSRVLQVSVVSGCYVILVGYYMPLLL